MFLEESHRRFAELDTNDDGVLTGSEELLAAVRTLVPEGYCRTLLDGASSENLAEVILGFDKNMDGKISQEEFDDFLRWIIAMDMKRYFETPCVDLHTLHPN